MSVELKGLNIVVVKINTCESYEKLLLKSKHIADHENCALLVK